MCACPPWKRTKNVLLGDEEWQFLWHFICEKENIVEPSFKATTQNAKVAYGRWYKSRTARAKFLSQPIVEWYIYSKIVMKVYFPLPITGSFIDKIISYSM